LVAGFRRAGAGLCHVVRGTVNLAVQVTLWLSIRSSVARSASNGATAYLL
jgi:hypothetical protein